MVSWRDRLKEIDLDAFRDSGEADKSVITDKRGAFGSFDSFGSASGNLKEASAAETPASTLATSPDTEATTQDESRVLEEPGQLREWRDAFSAIDRDRPPKGYQEDLWHYLHRDAVAFLDTWGETAAALGWSTLDLFGVHRLAPTANYSAMGLLPLLRGSVVVAMTADSATVRRGAAGAHLTFRRQPPHHEAVLVWDLISHC